MSLGRILAYALGSPILMVQVKRLLFERLSIPNDGAERLSGRQKLG